MKEIKIRAWSHKEKEFKKNYHVRVVDGYIQAFCGKDILDIVQFTGLTDKNGVEIYEGDIVRSLEYADWVVKWYNEEEGGVSTYGYYMEVKGMPDVVTSINPAQAKNIEVIGNVYENPELIEESSNENS